MRLLTLSLLAWTVALAVATEQGAPRFTARVDAVRVSALVTHRGQPVEGLTAADFELRDNGVVQAIDRVDRAEVPLDVILALDTSRSVGDGTLDHLREAAKAALAVLRPSDRAALLGFSHHVRVFSTLTTERKGFAQALAVAQPSGGTALTDAVVSAILAADPEPGRRTLVIVYTDGIDTMGWTSPPDTIATARRADVVIYTVAPRKREQFRSSLLLGKYETTAAFLAELTDVTGGELIEAESDHIPRTFARIVQGFSQGYQLLFYPNGVENTGWHTLDLRLKNRRGEVRARRGYHAENRLLR